MMRASSIFLLFKYWPSFSNGSTFNQNAFWWTHHSQNNLQLYLINYNGKWTCNRFLILKNNYPLNLTATVSFHFIKNRFEAFFLKISQKIAFFWKASSHPNSALLNQGTVFMISVVSIVIALGNAHVPKSNLLCCIKNALSEVMIIHLTYCLSDLTEMNAKFQPFVNYVYASTARILKKLLNENAYNCCSDF